MNIDEFFDVVFLVDNCYIKSNSHILKARSQYFAAMFRHQNGFNEIQSQHYSHRQTGDQKFHLIKLNTVPKQIFNCIIQYLYSDSFAIQNLEVSFFVELIVNADYFMLPRLIQICSYYIRNYITNQNVLSILLLAIAHNSPDLRSICFNYMTVNETTILYSKEWDFFKKHTDPKLFHDILVELTQFKNYFFIQNSLEKYISDHSKVAKN